MLSTGLHCSVCIFVWLVWSIWSLSEQADVGSRLVSESTFYFSQELSSAVIKVVSRKSLRYWCKIITLHCTSWNFKKNYQLQMGQKWSRRLLRDLFIITFLFPFNIYIFTYKLLIVNWQRNVKTVVGSSDKASDKTLWGREVELPPQWLNQTACSSLLTLSISQWR